MTPILGETEHGAKRTRSDPRILPEVVVYDVDLTLGLPIAMSVTSGLNAIAHAVEALYARDRNPIVSLMAMEAITRLADALPRIVADPQDRDARADALYGAWLCGTCLGSVGMALHHKLCHTLGGSFDLPHAETHSVLLPHALAYTTPAVPDAIARLRPVLGDDPAAGLQALARRLGAPMSLAALGMAEDSIDRAADLALANPYWNPRPLTRDGIRALLARAWAGSPGRMTENIMSSEIAWFDEARSAEVVNARIGPAADPRTAQVMAILVRHLHAAVKEARVTGEEWMTAIQFLTATGQMCSDWRQEFILLSDVLGVSMLVDAINHQRPEGSTENTVLGPFHVSDAPQYASGANISLDGKGEPLLVSGRVIDGEGRPIAGATLDVWQANEDGFYDVQQPGV